ncbi:MAG: hypothetical protein WC121_05515 [Candidatus Kapaibacterium sp.]
MRLTANKEALVKEIIAYRISGCLRHLLQDSGLVLRTNVDIKPAMQS